MSDYDSGGVAVVERAIAAGVERMVLPNVDADSIEPMKKLHDRYPENTVTGIGLHPTELGSDPDTLLDFMEKELSKGEYAAVGEVGIDLHWPDSPPEEEQRRAFLRQLEWGSRYGLPVIIHSRDACDVTTAVIAELKEKLEAEGKGLPQLIFHSFTGDSEDVRAIRKICDPWFGVNGVVTFRNAAALREALPEIGADRILLETDSPYLAPVPFRGRMNESSYLPHILERVAEVLGIAPQRLEEITDHNAEILFFGQTHS